MRKQFYILLKLSIILSIILVCSAVLSIMVAGSDFVDMCMALSTMGLVCTAVYGFHSNREAIRLQTSMQFSLDVHKTLHSVPFKKRERSIQAKLSSLQSKGIVCPIEDLDDDDLKRDIREYCGYMDGIGILVMEHLMKPEVILYNAGVGLLRTYYLLKPFLEKSRQQRSEKATHDIDNKSVDNIIENSVGLYYAHFELLALEMHQRGPSLIRYIKQKITRAKKKVEK